MVGFLCKALTLLAVGAVTASAATEAPPDPSFGIEDYFKIRRVTELALSPDARSVAYGITSAPASGSRTSGEAADKPVVNVYLQSTKPGAEPRALEGLADATRLAWIPASSRLAFLSTRSGLAQLYACDTATGRVEQLTRASDAVEKFSFTADGKSFAYLTRAVADPTTSLYERLHNGNRGVVVDTNTLEVYDFVNPARNAAVHPLPAQLWIVRAGHEPARVPVPGDVNGEVGAFAWSSDGALLSVTYIPADLPPSLLGRYRRSSLGVFDVKSAHFRVLGAAADPSDTRPGVAYSGGEWIPGRRLLMIRRATETDPWVSPEFPDWAIVDVSQPLPIDAGAWQSIEMSGSNARFIPAATGVLYETTVAGVHTLMNLTKRGRERSPFVMGVSGSSSRFSFSADSRTVAFVNESLTRPPEIFIRTRGTSPRQLTRWNDEIAGRVRYSAKEVNWTSTDGTAVKGWLLEPREPTASKPWPLVMHVHGGPGFAVTDSFTPYFKLWPYPLEVMASHGTAVFMPNYRGTMTYGRAFASPLRLEGAPVEDLLTGVQSLIDAGVADPRRLGISGHSHGAWLAPLAMTRARLFRAGSFAEGMTNKVINYQLMSGDLNREVHDAIMGGSLYDSPQTYIDGSADFFFKGASQANLFEAGARSLGIGMMGGAKASRYFGATTEFVIYPRTGHNPTLMTIQRESAQRNLDWFDRWLRKDGATESRQ